MHRFGLPAMLTVRLAAVSLSTLQVVHDYSPAEFRNSVIGLAKLGIVHKLPTVLTTSHVQAAKGELEIQVPQIRAQPRSS